MSHARFTSSTLDDLRAVVRDLIFPSSLARIDQRRRVLEIHRSLFGLPLGRRTRIVPFDEVARLEYQWTEVANSNDAPGVLDRYRIWAVLRVTGEHLLLDEFVEEPSAIGERSRRRVEELSACLGVTLGQPVRVIRT